MAGGELGWGGWLAFQTVFESKIHGGWFCKQVDFDSKLVFGWSVLNSRT